MPNLNLPYAEASRILTSMSLEQKIGQLVIASIEVTCMDQRTRDFLQKYCIGNVILFGKNCYDRRQLAQLTQSIQDIAVAATGVQSLLSIDQEGGRVTRIRRGATVFPSAMAVTAAGNPELAYQAGFAMGQELRALGICHNLAPVLDCNMYTEQLFPNNRSYGFTPEQVTEYAIQAARGMQDAGILACGKHFPGQGHGAGDTHFDFVVHPDGLDEIMTRLAPFRAAMQQGLWSVMSSHSCYPALDSSGLPATLSSEILQNLARKKLGFDGLIVSDDILMAAIEQKFGAPEGAMMALQAGCDMVIIGNGGDNANPDGLDVQPPIVEHLVQAAVSGRLSMQRIDESVLRVLAVKLAMGDMRPQANVTDMDWSEHEVLSQTLADRASHIMYSHPDSLPVPEGSLFLGRRSQARLGVEEGDRLFESFAELAASSLLGEAAEFDMFPDLPVLAPRIRNAPAVVFSVTNREEYQSLLPSLKEIRTLARKLIVVCLDVPQTVEELDSPDCVLVTYDQTIHSAHAAIRMLKGEGLC